MGWENLASAFLWLMFSLKSLGRVVIFASGPTLNQYAKLCSKQIGVKLRYNTASPSNFC